MSNRNGSNIIMPGSGIIGAPGTILDGIRPEDFETTVEDYYTKVDQTEFYKQLDVFKKDNTKLEESKVALLDNHRYLIEVFKFNKYPSGNVLLSDEQCYEFTHVAKVLQVGSQIEDSKYKVGDIIFLNPYYTCGQVDSPEFVHARQFSQGNMKPIMPPDVKEKVARIQVNYERFAYVLPHDYAIPRHLVVTYAIPESEITCKYVG